MATHEQTITITEIPEDMSPTGLSRAGELMALEACGPSSNPNPQAWGRAGLSASMILRRVHKGKISMDVLVAMIALNSDPANDDNSHARTKLITNHVTVEDEWPPRSPSNLL